MDQAMLDRRRDVVLTELSCAACVGRVERVLGRLPGVESVSVNLATNRASFQAGPEFDSSAMLAALDRAGYPAATETLDLAITGMDCASCVGRVERALNKVAGVRSASVNLATARARVEVTAGLVELALLQQAVAKAGYQAAPVTSNAEPPSHRQRDGIAAAAALLLAAPLLTPMLLVPFGIHAMLPPLLQFALAAIVQFVFGARFYRGAWIALRNGSGTMDTLVALGSSAAFGLSLWTLAVDPGGPLYFEASAAVIALVRVGKWLEALARREAGGAIRALDQLRPETCTLRDPDGQERRVPAASLHPGDLILIHPGERIAADCTVREGSGSSNESLLTGEAMPVEKQPGSRLVGGALNGDAVLLASVDAVGAGSRLGHMVRLVEDAQAAKPQVQRLVDRVSAVFVPAVVLIALLTFLGWWLAGLGAGPALVRAVSVLVVACPCALGLATPAAIMAGIGAAAKHGILIRDPDVLEQAGRLRTVVFDKTGTLTEGRPVLDAIHPAPGQIEADILRLARQLQHNSEHPLAKALLDRQDAATDHGREPTPGRISGRAPMPVDGDLVTAQDETTPTDSAITGVRGIPGRGVVGEIDGTILRVGTAALMREAGIDPSALDTQACMLRDAGRTVSFLARDTTLLGLFAFADAVKPGAAESVAALRRAGIRVVMLTGDNRGAADAVARAVGIDEVHADALPDGKAARIAALRELGPVAMVGDGVNDAPALAAADLGLAMATGTDVAMAASGITLMHGAPELVPAALEIAVRTMRRIRSGLFWAFAYNLVGIPLAIAGLLSPVLAGAAMAFSSVLVVGNAMLLRGWRPPTPS